jgi:hypothetical protein
MYKYIMDDSGRVIGIEPLEQGEGPRPSWWDSLASMFPQYQLMLKGVVRPMMGMGGATYSSGGVIMEGGKPKYPNSWKQAWASYFGFPTTTFDPNDYLYRQYKDYWTTATSMSQSRANDIMGVDLPNLFKEQMRP